MKLKTSICLSALALVFGSGCRIDHVITLYPDGSGKFTLTVAKREEVTLAPKNSLLEEFEGRWGGVVAWTEPVIRSEGGWNSLTLTGYFDDINSFRIWDNQYSPATPTESRKAAWSIDYTKSESGHRLVMKSPKEHFSETAGDWKPNGGRLLNQLIIPGSVKEATGVTFREGRSAGILIDDAFMTDLVAGKEETKKKAAEADKGVITLTWLKSDLSDDDAQAFKKELTQAKEHWQVLREEWKKAGKRK